MSKLDEILLQEAVLKTNLVISVIMHMVRGAEITSIES